MVGRSLALGFCLLTSVSPAVAEIVVLDNGRFLQVTGYSIDARQARLELRSGGELVLPLIRIQRIIDDEIVRIEEPLPVPDERLAVDLGFPAEAEVPDVPFGQHIFDFARATNINPELVVAVVRAESAFDPDAVSSKGARGLMQIMPATGKQLGALPSELFDPEINLKAGISYLGSLIERYSSDLTLVLAAYNAGEGAVTRYRGVPPYRETRDYIRRIYSFLGIGASEPESSGK